MARPKKKNAEYFSHDKDMRNDPKIKAVRRKYGHEGAYAWVMLLEHLTDCDDLEYELTDINLELLSGDFDIESGRLGEIIDYLVTLGLIQREGDLIFSANHKARLEDVFNKRERARQNNRKGVSVTETRQAEGFPTTETPQEPPLPATEITQSKVKYSKVKKSKEDKNKSLSEKPENGDGPETEKEAPDGRPPDPPKQTQTTDSSPNTEDGHKAPPDTPVPKGKNGKPPKPTAPSEDGKRFLDWFLSEIFSPEVPLKPPQRKKWALVYDELLWDGYEEEQIKQACINGRDSDIYSPHFLSATKLRSRSKSQDSTYIEIFLKLGQWPQKQNRNGQNTINSGNGIGSDFEESRRRWRQRVDQGASQGG